MTDGRAGPRVQRFCRDCGQALALSVSGDIYVAASDGRAAMNVVCPATGRGWHSVATLPRERTVDDDPGR